MSDGDSGEDGPSENQRNDPVWAAPSCRSWSLCFFCEQVLISGETCWVGIMPPLLLGQHASENEGMYVLEGGAGF